MEDAEAAAHVILAAQRITGTDTLAAVMATAGLSLRSVEPDRVQRNQRTWIPLPCPFRATSSTSTTTTDGPGPAGRLPGHPCLLARDGVAAARELG
ncbi:hypothetical protein [Nonomuraea rosea]|uniref:hypothetical protein n=1 Tax=Nonomuraea rosea TaxID=638574 RepID=UPI0031E97F9A